MPQPLDEIYTPENVPLDESLYGKGLISLGGYEAVDRMVEGLDLSGKTLLDIGSGIGGIPIHLAQTYNCSVIGLDIYPWMEEYATGQVDPELRGRVRFVTGTPGDPLPLESESVDLVYSKGVLTNIKDKLSLFKEIHRVLKPGGETCFIDWVVPETVGSSTQTLTTGEASYKETPSSYKDLLKEAGFDQVKLEDVSQEYRVYVKGLQDRLTSEEHKEAFSEIISRDLRDILIKANSELLEAVASQRQLSYRVRASKSSPR